MERSERDTSKILSIYQLLERTKSMATMPIGHKFQTLEVDLVKFRSHAFSDTVTISCPFESFDYFNDIIGPRGKRWGKTGVYQSLTNNEVYKGTLIWGRNSKRDKIRLG